METLTGQTVQLSLTKDCENIFATLDKSDRPIGPVQEGRSFRSEISALRKFSELLDKVRRAQPPRAHFEERLWEYATVLISRCRKTLSGIDQYLRDQQQAEDAANACPGGCSSYPQRTHVNLQTKTLQLTLLTFNL